MVRRTLPLVESLEGRALLSGLEYSLTTDQSIYNVGQSINLTFTETNTSDQPVTVQVSPVDFSVAQGGTVVWQSNPGNNGQPATSETLLPGQSASQTAAWNGVGNYSPGSGGVQHPLPVNYFGSFVVSNPNAPPDLTATFQITDPITRSLTTDQSVYALGQPIQLTYKEVNSGSQRVTVLPEAPAGFGISHDGATVLAASLVPPASSSPITLEPGQAITHTQTWDGIPPSGPYTFAKLTGNFDVAYGPSANPTQTTTTFQIAPPAAGDLVTKIATDKAVYDLGQPVTVTFKETNTSASPLAVLTGPTEFEVTQNGMTVWAVSPPTPNIAQPAWLTLQPGQSYSQTATWDGRGATTGAFAVSNAFDPTASFATFQIVNAGSNPPPASSSVDVTLLTHRHTYKIGQRVPLTLALENVSASRVAIRPRKSTQTVIVQLGSSLVFESRRKMLLPAPATIKPGHTLKLATAWSGKVNQAGTKTLSPGTYTITVSDDGYVAQTTIQLVARHKQPKR